MALRLLISQAMRRLSTPPCAGDLRAGRLLDTPDGLVDLATGREARVEACVVPEDEAARWSAPTLARVEGGRCAVDGWLTQDWLGRWVARVVTVPMAEGETAAAEHEDARCATSTDGFARWVARWSPDAIAVTRTRSLRQWCALASLARAHGVAAAHPAMLAMVCSQREPTRWPPLVLAVEPHGVHTASAVAMQWVRRGGRVAGLVVTHGLPPATHPVASYDVADGVLAGRVEPSHTAHARLVQRAWRALTRAPDWPDFTGMVTRTGGLRGMTHLELLDVSAQLDEARRDEDAFGVACRAVRQHARADHAAVLATYGADTRVLASDGAAGESMAAWRQLAPSGAPDAVTSVFGWHAVGRQALDHGATLIVGARWSSREASEGRHELLTVFARLAAGRAARVVVSAGESTPRLEQTLVGDSTVMRDVRAQIALAARAPFPVLVRGESGCGKELAARAIHALGQRRHRRCAAINCAALPDDLIESELFGHVRGAFTGAASDRLGLFDEADGGTLFLDEVGELGARAQAKLLRVLQDGEVRRVGENHARRVDVRVIAATNVSLEDAVRRGTFRADLFYRLDVVRVRMPSLRERREDIPVLAQHFWHECTARVGSRARLEGRVLEVLARADWPGNVRQLQNTLAALAVRVPPRGRVSIEDLPDEVRKPHAPASYLAPTGLDAARRQFEAGYVRDALTRAGGRSSLAARDLGLTRQGLSKLVRRLGLDEEDAGSRLP